MAQEESGRVFDDRRGRFVTAEHDQDVAHHRCLAFPVEVGDAALVKSFERHFDHPDRALDDASCDNGVGVPWAKHCLSDPPANARWQMRSSKISGPAITTRSAISTASSPATTSVEPRGDARLSAGLS